MDNSGNVSSSVKKKVSMKDRMKKLTKPLGKLGQQKHLSALRDGFALSLPLTIAGAVAILFITIVFGGWGAEKTSLLGLLAHSTGHTTITYSNLLDNSTSWSMDDNYKEIAKFGQTLFGWINSATLGQLSLYATFLIGFSMASIRRTKNPVMAGIVSVAVLLVFSATSNGVDISIFGPKYAFMAIIAGLFGSEMYSWLSNSDKLTIKMPAGVPPAVGRAFAALLPSLITLISAATINVFVGMIFWIDSGEKLSEGGTIQSLSYMIDTVITKPFIGFAQSGGDIGILFVYLFMVTFLFFFGIHGPNTLNGIFGPVATLLWIGNIGGDHNVFVEGLYNGFAFVGGAGGTLPLVILTLWMMNTGSEKEVAKFALPAGIFEINEPVIFGYPILFNFKYFVPFVFGPMLAAIWPVIAIKLDWMNAPTILAPWTTPPLLYPLIATQFDWRAGIVAIMSITTLFMVWTPFVLSNKRAEKKAMKMKAKNESVIV